MELSWIVIAVKIFIALSILNVWLIRFNKATPWRGGSAQSMSEEFHTYGLSKNIMYLIGGLKILFALGLIISIWYPFLTTPSAAGIAILMAGAVSMHARVKDNLKKSLPAFSFMVLSLFLIFYSSI